MECRFQQVLTVFGRFPSVPVPLCCHRLPLASLPDFNCFEQLRTVRLFTGVEFLPPAKGGIVQLRFSTGARFESFDDISSATFHIARRGDTMFNWKLR